MKTKKNSKKPNPKPYLIVYNLSMFVLSPFIGLLYIFLLPVVTTTLLVWYTCVHFLPEHIKSTISLCLGEGAISPIYLIKHSDGWTFNRRTSEGVWSFDALCGFSRDCYLYWYNPCSWCLVPTSWGWPPSPNFFRRFFDGFRYKSSFDFLKNSFTGKWKKWK